MGFKEQVEHEIKDFSKVQKVAFAWRCALRVLPFLGINGHFNFWKKKYSQKHLYSVFNALDVGIYYVNYLIDTQIIVDAHSAIDIALSEINEVNEAYMVANSVSFAIATADAANETGPRAITRSTIFATYAAAYATKNHTFYKVLNLVTLISDDIKAIRTYQEPILNIDDYGLVFDNFIEALEKNDCSYWATWYEQLFKNDFKFDLEEVKQRIKNVPDSIKSQGAAAVGHYMEDILKGGGKRLNEARILILGDKGAGKTCVAKKLIDPTAPMTTPAESTPGVDTSTWKLAKENMNVSIWDFAGHTVTHAVHQFFLSERCLYILIYNGRTENTSRLEYWLDHMKNYGGDSEAIILVNERDQHHNEIPINRLKEQYAIAEVFYLNVAKDTQKFKKFRKYVSDYIVTNPSWENQQIPKSYYTVKEELEERFANNKDGKTQEQITKEDFDAIAKEHDIKDSERLLQDLHALGVSLWYKGMEQYNTLILNPEWISDGVYQIINWVSDHKTHEVALVDFKKVFQDEKDKKRYPKKQYDFLFDLILNYELAYQTDKGKRLIIPHLLKEDQPDHLPIFGIDDSLMLKYKADQALPPHTISRFIVKHSDQIQKKGKEYLVWRYGVILEDGNGNIALVREWDRAIDVSVKGPTKTEYISELRETLNEIFNGYKSKKPELQYNITRFGDEEYLKMNVQFPERIEKLKENWLAEQTILSYLKRNRDYYDVISNKEIPPKEIVNMFNIQVQGNQNFISKANAVSTGDHANTQINTFNFKDCNISLQGNLQDLALELSANGEEEAAKELEIAAKALEKVENETEPDQIKKKGVWNRLKRTITNLNDEKSTLHQAVKLLKNGKALVKGIMETYEKVSPWIEQMTQS